MINTLTAPVLAAALVAGLAGDARANPAWQGRWEGEAAIPGAPLALIVDLALDSTPGRGGHWVGSWTLPGRGVKGAALRAVVVDAQGIRSALPASFGDPAASGLSLQPQADGRLVGTLRQGGHEATVTLRRSGSAQVDPPLASTALSPSLEGTWTGRYELGGYPRDVTLTLANKDGVGGATLVIVGRRRSEVPVDLVIQRGGLLSIISSATSIALEARLPLVDGALRGQFQQGPFEADFVLRKTMP